MKYKTLAWMIVCIISIASACSPSTPGNIHIETILPTETQNPTETQAPTPSPTITPTPNHEVGNIVFHEANQHNPYYWFSYIPQSLSKETPAYILITGIRAETYDTYENLVPIARGEIERRTQLAEDYGVILLVPHIPRQDQPHIYTAAFSRIVFSDDVPGLYSRPDEKINLMIDDLMGDLRKYGYSVQEKVFLEGHSIGGMFALRYALIHPSRVKAIAAQCGGDFTLPVSTFNDLTLPWPIGVGDFSFLTGLDFNERAYKDIPQFIYTGEDDIGTENPLVIDYNGGNAAWWDMGWDYSTAQYWIRFVIENFGETWPQQTENQVLYANGIGFNKISFKLYPNIGHKQTEEMLQDSMDFLFKYIEGE